MDRIKLDIPHRSQWDVPSADLAVGDCGPTCVAMLLNGLGQQVTPDDLYYVIYPDLKDNPGAAVPNKGYTHFGQLARAALAHGLTLERYTYAPGGALESLKTSLQDGSPSIVLVKYVTWRARTGNDFSGAHFVIAVGCDDEHVLVHDPLFGSAYKTKPAKGAFFEWTNDEFKTAWGGFEITENPNYACLTAQRIYSFLEGKPAKEEEKKEEKVGKEHEKKPVDMTAADDAVKRRILALAAYEGAAVPNLDDKAALSYWVYHVGRWGEQIAVHIVKSGDSLWNIAAQHYGQGGKWRAIMAYNELTGSVIAVGQRLEVPLPGLLDVSELIDPTQPAIEEQDGVVKVPAQPKTVG